MPKIYLEICDGCGLCKDACSNTAITIENNKAVINKDLCLGCGICIGSCPNGAISPETQKTEYPYPRPVPRRPLFYYPRYRPFLNSYSYKIRRKRW